MNNAFTALEIHTGVSGNLSRSTGPSGPAIRTAVQRGRETLARMQELLLGPNVQQSEAGPNPPQDGAAGSHVGLCILLVEDNPEVRTSLCELLSSWGCVVSLAGTTPEAELLFRQHDSHLAIIDVHLERNSGIGLSVRLRRVQPGCRILLISGAPLTPEARAVADLALEKPISPLQLRGALQALFPD